MTNDNDVIDLDAERTRRKALIKTGARLQRKIREAREHPLGLYKLCFAADDGHPVTLKWFHEEWADMLLNNHKAMIEAPRGSTKTSFIVAAVLWFIGHNPELRIKFICGNDTNAGKRLTEIRNHINNDPMYQQVFPGVEEDPDKTNNASVLNLKCNRMTKDSTLEAKGILSDGTGDRSDLIILDDICTRKNSVDEPSTRPRVLGKLRSDWLNTLVPKGGRVWNIFTPWHEEDANAILKKEAKSEWVYRRYAHGKPNDPYHSIFPELFSREWLRAKQLEIGAREYAQGYLCKAVSEDIQIVQAKWLHEYNQYDITPELLKYAACIVSVDPTGAKADQRAKHSKVDYYGFSVLLIDSFSPLHNPPGRPEAPNRIFIPDAYQVHLSTGNAAQHTIELAHQWAADAVLVEAQGAQSLHEWVYERDTTLNVVPIPATLSKKARLESITPWLQDYRQRIMFHPRVVNKDPEPYMITIGGPDPTQAEATRVLRRQLLDFPTTHDDVMDSTVQGLRYVRQYILPLDNQDSEGGTRNRDQEIEVEVKMVSC